MSSLFKCSSFSRLAASASDLPFSASSLFFSSSRCFCSISRSYFPELPFPYNKTLDKISFGKSKDPAKSYSKLAQLCYNNEEMIPNFKLAEKYAEKAKKKYPLALAIIAAITSDERAGKPNKKKAEKLFKEAYELEPSIEIGKMFAEFLIADGRETEAVIFKSLFLK